MALRHMKVILIGDRRVGKSSLVSAVKKGTFSRRYLPTNEIATDTLRFRLNNNDTVLMNVWDFAGGEYPYCYARNVDGIIIAFDTTSLQSYESALKSVTLSPLHSNVILCGTKVDKKRRAVWPTDIIEGIPYYEVSAKDSYNAHFPFLHVIRSTLYNDNLGFL